MAQLKSQQPSSRTNSLCSAKVKIAAKGIVVPVQVRVGGEAARVPTVIAKLVPARAADAVVHRWLVDQVAQGEVARVPAVLVLGVPAHKAVVPDRKVATSIRKLPSSIANSIECCGNLLHSAARGASPVASARRWADRVVLVLAADSDPDLDLLVLADPVRRLATCADMAPVAHQIAEIAKKADEKKIAVMRVAAKKALAMANVALHRKGNGGQCPTANVVAPLPKSAAAKEDPKAALKAVPREDQRVVLKADLKVDLAGADPALVAHVVSADSAADFPALVQVALVLVVPVRVAVAIALIDPAIAKDAAKNVPMLRATANAMRMRRSS